MQKENEKNNLPPQKGLERENLGEDIRVFHTAIYPSHSIPIPAFPLRTNVLKVGTPDFCFPPSA